MSLRNLISWTRKMTLLFPALGLLVSLFACSNSNAAGNREPYWKVDESGYFYTNIVQRAQGEVPFAIVLPSYLPKIMEGQNPDMTGQVNDAVENNRIELRVEYILPKAKGKGLIVIYEWNYPHLPPDVKHDPMVKPIQLDGIVVSQTQADPLYRGTDVLKGSTFMWNTNQVYFQVDVYEFTDADALKIVESMVKQTQSMTLGR